MIVYVVTNPEDGWDCVRGVFLTLRSLKEYFYEALDLDDEEQNICDELTFTEFEDRMAYACDDLIIHEIEAR